MALGLLCFQPRCAAAGEPRLVCADPVYDYGTADNSRDIRHTFVIVNSGDAPLIIANTRATCGCTRTALGTNIVAPGASTELEARLSLRGFNGPKRSSIYIHSNDPLQPVFQVQFTGVATAEVSANPPIVVVEQAVPMSPADRSVTIVSRAEKPLSILSLTTRGGHFSATLSTNKPGAEFTIAIHFAGVADHGDHEGAIVITTDHPAYRAIEVPVRLTLLAPLAVTPPSLALPRARGAAPQHRYVVIRSRDEQNFKLLRFAADDPDLPVTIQSTRPSWYRLRVGPYPADGPSTATVIRITTDLDSMPSIRVPVTIDR